MATSCDDLFGLSFKIILMQMLITNQIHLYIRLVFMIDTEPRKDTASTTIISVVNALSIRSPRRIADDSIFINPIFSSILCVVFNRCAIKHLADAVT